MKHQAPEATTSNAVALSQADGDLDAAIDKAQASYEGWREERRQRGRAVMQAARRTWAAMEGWDRVETQKQWEQLRAQAIEDWESGAALLTMLGGTRYIEPERAALCLMLWQDFLTTYQPSGPAEYMVVAMAVLAFDHFLRVNGLVNNLEARLEHDYFSLDPLTTTASRDPFATVARAKHGGKFGLTAQMHAEELSTDMLPLLDRLNRMVIRNLRALRELRGGGLAVTVQNFGQVNVGATQTNSSSPSPTLRNASPKELRRKSRRS